jgi:oxygen-independent coproporphyrinogen-3 oxidase
MAGLYIHIPFCRTKCAYCDFFSMPISSLEGKQSGLTEGQNGLADGKQSGHVEVMQAYCDAVIQEFELRCKEISEPLTTIYIGGGTPTALPMPLLTIFLQEVYSLANRFNCGRAAITEFTIEANPEDITAENLRQLRSVGVNRISIGVQSFNTAQLNRIKRFHDADTSVKALTVLRDSGINYSADLIYGLPGQSVESWHEQLKALLSFRPPHFSSYLLSYEPGTRLYAMKERGVVAEADEATAVEMYRILCREAALMGYNHYEISNFALPGYEARHNSAYWDLSPYLGLGCSAHSFDGSQRRINPLHLQRYLQAINRGTDATEIDEETTLNSINDYIITSLRTAKGLSLELIRYRWGSSYAREVAANLAPELRLGHLAAVSNQEPAGVSNYRIPEEFWLTADAIMREIIL